MRGRLVATAMVLVLAGCTTEPGAAHGPTGAPTAGPWHGGTLRVMTLQLSVADLDPANYFGWAAWELHRCCLSRTLISYPGVPTAEGGAEPRPDLADGMPTVSEDGLTWRFTLKRGLHYAPPFDDREIVSADIVRALERRVVPWGRWGYGFYYSVIKGYEEFRSGDAGSITGLETPDRYTLIVRLEEPTGDLPSRFALGATAPVPEGAAEGHLKDYARFLASSGPYMIEGSEALLPSLSPAEQPPVSGLIPGESLTLVRDPSWDPATDHLREAFADRIQIDFAPIELTADPAATSRAAARVDSGAVDLDLIWTGSSSRAVHPADRIRVDAQNTVSFIPMNLAVPPFDDVDVRKAVALVIDREGSADSFGETFGVATPATHLAPDAATGGLLSGWRPSWMRGPGADLTAARAAMRRSAYDTDGDGRCDAEACRAVRALVQRFDPADAWGWRWEPIRDALERIGIGLDVVGVGFSRCQARDVDPMEHWGLMIGYCTGWAMDYPNGATWFPILFDSSMLGMFNHALVGASEQQLAQWGYEVTNVPSVDERVHRCETVTGDVQTSCWAELDQYLTEDIIPAAPLFGDQWVSIVSDRVASYSFAQSTAQPAFDRIALVPGSE